MARPLRIEFAGALYHVTSRGDRREAVFEDDDDYVLFLSVLKEVVERFNWLCHAYCLMTNHYDLVVETPDGNLSKGMRQLNGLFTQASNRRHRHSGPVFQGRFKATLVDKQRYLLELTRDVVLSPVREKRTKRPDAYSWSSYRAMIGTAPIPTWLTTDTVLSQFGKRRAAARQRYSRFVHEGMGLPNVWSARRQQIYLGDAKFVERMQKKAQLQRDERNIPRRHRKPPPSIAAIAAKHRERNPAIIAAYNTRAYSYREIAEHFAIHLSTVGRMIRKRMLQGEN
jgi:putative transposase